VFGLCILDILVIASYLALVIGIGIWASRRVKNLEDYFLAGRRFGPFIQTFAAFGQATSADNAVGVTTTTFTNGIAGIWSSLVYLAATPMYWLVMPWMRRLRVLTLGDFFQQRYGSKGIAAVYAVIGSIGMMTIISVGLAAMTKTVVALAPKPIERLTAAERAELGRAEVLDRLLAQDYDSLTADQKDQLNQLIRQRPRKVFSYIREDLLIWLVCGVVLVYAVAGGLEAAFLTDTIQGLFIIVLSILLIPFACHRINQIYGGSGLMDALETLHARLPESFFEVFGSPVSMDFTWYYIAALTIMVTINVVVQPNSLAATASARGEYECRFGFVAGSYIKRVCTVLWGFFALLAVVLYHDQIHDPDLVWGYATLDLLGPLQIGLVGLMIACLMAALMSTADCLMITGASLLTNNIYRPIFPGCTERHYVQIGRWFGALVLICGAMIATQFDTILQQLKLWWELNVTVAASFWLGMKWRRANKTGAWCSILATAICFFVLPILLPVLVPGLRTEPMLLRSTRPVVVTRLYKASQMDVLDRQRQIQQWEGLPDGQKHMTTRPESLAVGQVFRRHYQIPGRSIFWTKGIKQDRLGRAYGSGMLNLELILLDRLGVDLEAYPYALNETIRILIRTIVPFLILMAVSLITAPDDKDLLDRFYARMRTPVLRDRKADAELLNAGPDRLGPWAQQKVFAHSNWELYRWTRTDLWGFVISCLTALAIILLLVVLVRVGR